MRLAIEFPELGRVVSRMGARRSSWRLDPGSLNPREELRAELKIGKEIPLSEVEPAHGDLLTYKGEQVVLYIKDTRLDRNTLLYDITNSRRFHVADCKTLDRMRREGRFERYVVTTRKDGEFLVCATNRITGAVEELEAPLAVCKNCLTAIDWKGYNERGWIEKEELWRVFSLEDFFVEFSAFFLEKPTNTDVTAPKGGYAPEWSRISERLRREARWRCAKCGVDLSQYRRLLHCHHKNGVVSDNRRDNIEVLCILCHAEEPSHNQLKPRAQDRVLIESLRRR